MPEPQSPAEHPQKQPRAWWQYLMAMVLFSAAGWLVVDGYVIKRKNLPEFKTTEPLPIRVDAGLKASKELGAKAGEFSGFNVLLVTFDTTRADRIGCYGNDGIETPNLDRLARSGVLFSQAVAVAPTTLPSHTSVLTGLYPYHHGARANGNYRLANDKTTLAEILSAKGYETAAFVSAMVLESGYGLDQGFDVYSDDVSEGVERPWTGDPVLPGDKTTDRALEWMSQRGEHPFFVWVHYFDPHAPHEAPAPYNEKYAFAYDGEIAFTDEQLGRLLGGLDQNNIRDKTIVVVVGDHGESFGQHNELTHGWLVHDSTLHVPMLMACGDRLGGGIHVDRRVSQIDVMPTVLSLLGITAPEGLDGSDLTERIPDDRVLYSDTLEGYVQYGLAPLIALFDGNHKYIHGPKPELYDIAADPFEQENLIAKKPDVARKLKDELKSLVGDNIDESLFKTSQQELDPAERDKLAALGYVRDGDAVSSDRVIDPKDFLELNHLLERAIAVDVHLGPEKSIPMFEKIVEQYPDFVMPQRHLGDAHRRAGHDDEAEAAYLKTIEMHPASLQPRIELGRMAMLRGDFEEAEQHFVGALEVGPGRLGVLVGLSEAYLRQGKLEDAARVLKDGFNQHPADPEITERMMETLLRLGRIDECRRLLSETLKERPRLVAVRNALAGLLANNGDPKEAVKLLREGLELSPDTPQLIVNLGLVLATSMSDPEIYYPTEATVLLENVCEKTKYSDSRYMHTLSLAYWSLSRIDEALAMANRALKVAENEPDKRFVQTISKTIEGLEKAKARGVSAMQRIRPTGISDDSQSGD